jgi:hypothetical protein
LLAAAILPKTPTLKLIQALLTLSIQQYFKNFLKEQVVALRGIITMQRVQNLMLLYPSIS